MSEETTKAEVEDRLTPETFNMLDVLSGVAYPSEAVKVYLSEDGARQVVRLRDQIERDYEAQGKAVPKKLKDALAEAVEALRATEFTFHLRGVPPEVARNARARAKQKFPDRREKVQGMDIPIPTEEQDRYTDVLVTAACVEKIVDSKGREHPQPEPEAIQSFFDRAPASQTMKLVNAVNSLQVQSDEFERAVSDDFLAKP